MAQTLTALTPSAPSPTAGATLTLSTNAEKELADLRAAAHDSPGGVLFYLDTTGHTDNPQVLTAPRDQPFEAVALAGNYGVKDHDFTMLCIVDYQQAPCRRGTTDKAFNFHLASTTETRLPVSLALDPGTHDVLFLTFYDPNNHSTDQAFRQDSRFLFSFYRVQIISGAAAAHPLPPMDKFTTPSGMQVGGSFFTISRDKFTDPAQPPWHSDQFAAGAPLNFFAAYANGEQVSRTVALMAFMDFGQVPWDASHNTFFGQLDAGARADVPAALTAPTTAGEHELVVVAVDNPYLDLASQVNAGQPRSFFANSSDRVLITVH